MIRREARLQKAKAFAALLSGGFEPTVPQRISQYRSETCERRRVKYFES